eukprot:365246-Chlamydomonas_euryale.AAC.1
MHVQAARLCCPRPLHPHACAGAQGAPSRSLAHSGRSSVTHTPPVPRRAAPGTRGRGSGRSPTRRTTCFHTA